MPGEQVILVGDRGGRIRSFVAAIDRFPTEPQWAVVGGFAVNVRISQVHRLTNDIDTVSRNQPSFVEVLVSEFDADRLANAKLQLTQYGTAVIVEVMADASSAPLPAEDGERAFALARSMALSTCEPVELQVVMDSEIVARASAPIASTPALIALKAVAIPRRSQSNSPAKVGSDIHDLVRLVQCCDFDETVASITEASAELRGWVGTTLVRWFSPNEDLRYTFARLRRLTSSPDAEALIEGDLALVAELGHALQP